MRIKGNSSTREFIPEVSLVNRSTNPIGTLVSMWIGTRFNETIGAEIIEELYSDKRDDKLHSEYMRSVYPHEAHLLCEYYPEYSGEHGTDYVNVIENLANMIVKGNFPLLESVNFTFRIDDASVAWREQLVRGRCPQNFWMQSSRSIDLSSIDVNRLSSIKEYGGDEAVEIYDEAVQTIRNACRMLVELGVPVEDIRLIPQNMTHRVYWMVPYRTLLTTLGKRIGWLAQSTLWSPVVSGIMRCLRQVSPILANPIGVPPEVKIVNGEVVNHNYDSDNEDRYYGRDPQPVDPLWLAYKGLKLPSHTDMNMYRKMKSMYINIWSDEVCGILGWDKNNPDKEGYYDIPE